MNKEQIEKYFSGQCTPEEAAKFLQWLNTENSEEELNNYLDVYLKEIDDETSVKSHVLEKLHKIIDEKQESQSRSLNFSWWKIAASVSLIIMLSFGVYLFVKYDKSTLEAQNQTSNWVTKSTEKGQKLTVNLPDGSVVMLNSESEINYPSDFSDSIRKVKLLGEAFFEVQKQDNPFVVQTADINTIVLGTSFNVRYRSLEENIEVSLLSGRVNIESLQHEEVQLLPGDRIVYDLLGHTFNMEKYEYKQDFGWKDGILYFDQAKWNEVRIKLERWFGVEIIVDSEIEQEKHFSGSFMNENLKNILESLSFTYGFEYQLQNKNVWIKFNK